MRKSRYLISLYYSEPGVEATFAAGFGGSKRIEHLSDGAPGRIVGRPDWDVPACFVRKLVRTSKPWWEQNGVMYPIQIKLKSSTTEKEQERILVETANSTVTTQRKLKRTISSSTLREPASLRSDGVRDHPGMPFGFPPEYAFSFAGIPIAKS